MGSARARTRSGGRRVSTVALAAIVALSLLPAACTPNSGGGSPSDPGPGDTSLPAPTSRHGDGSVELAWTVVGPTGATYEWEWRRSGVTTWSTATTAVPQLEISTDLTPRAFHWARVRHVAPDGTAGEWSSGAKFFFTDLTLPVVRIDTAGGAPIVDKENYIDAALAIDPNGSSDAAYAGTTKIRGRGNSTWSAAKKPYRMKLTTAAGLLGMPAERDWVLLANAFDPSHLRNQVAFDLSRRTGLAWTPEFRYVEVVLNGSYDGIYMLGSQVEVGPSRVNVTEMDEGDIAGEELTGGYLLEFDFRLDLATDPGFVSSDGVQAEIKDPDPPTPEQLSYITGYFNSFEASVRSPSYTDPNAGYRAYLDVDAFIDWYLIVEIAKQQDGMWSSTYVSKPRGGKLTFGPVWDFDLSMGAVNHLTPGWPPEGWWINLPLLGRWLPRIMSDPATQAQTHQRWDELKPAFQEVVDAIPATAAAIDPARRADAARWRVAVGPQDTDANLQRWLDTRISWIDSQL